MAAPATKLPFNLARDVAVFLRGYSLEATRPNAADVDTIARAAPQGTAVYLSAIPSQPHQELIAAALRIRAAGLEPVPHLAARTIASPGALDDLVGALASEAGVKRLLVIAGDRDTPAGPFRSALEVIETGVLPSRGITEIGIAGYPEGHPRITAEALDRALAAKVEAAEQTGLGVNVVTQFAFAAAPILAFVRRLRDLGIDHPVRIGLAGPTSLATLLRYAQRCGVRASAQGLARQAGLAKHLFSNAAPDAIVAALAQALAGDEIADVALHLFSFGGAGATARWAAAAGSGRVTPDGNGFRVEPPGG
jgi:methylenetetrahydrofolate reductase (NADPH)